MSAVVPNSESDQDLASLSQDQAHSFVQQILAAAPATGFVAQEILDKHPELCQFPSCVVDLAYEEYCQARESGNPIPPGQFVQRYSGVEQSLIQAIKVDEVLHANPELVESVPEHRWPRKGQLFCGCQLMEQIGRGALSRVFLARQVSLGNRLVVVKICIRGEREADLLGMLEYSGIAKVHSIDHDTATGLTLICMPFVTRVTMHNLAEWLASDDNADSRLDPQKTQPPVAVSTQSPPSHSTTNFILSPSRVRARASHIRQFINECHKGDKLEEETSPDESSQRTSGITVLRDRDKFASAILKWGCQLASALAHAHSKEVLHCDVKPGNVLILPDLSARLLDFNLADSGHDSIRLAGGTLPFMASEQLELLLQQSDPKFKPAMATSSPLSGKTDVFGLCATLWHLATGEPPFGTTKDIPDRNEAASTLLDLQKNGVSIQQMQQIREILPSTIVAVLVRGLSYDPNDRQSSTAELAIDFRRRLKVERSIRRGISILIVAATMLMTFVAAKPLLVSRGSVEKAIKESRLMITSGRFDDAGVFLAPFVGDNEECRFLEQIRKTCTLPPVTYQLPGKFAVTDAKQIQKEWEITLSEWLNLSRTSLFATEAFMNSALIQMEMGNFDGARQNVMQAVRLGINTPRSQRLTILLDVLHQQKLGVYGHTDALEELRLEVEKFSRGEFMALFKASFQNLQNDMSLSSEQFRTKVLALLEYWKDVEHPVAEPSVAHIGLHKRRVVKDDVLKKVILKLVHEPDNRKGNSLNRVLLFPMTESRENQENRRF